MPKIKTGQVAGCAACGRKVVVTDCGTSLTTIWCCGQPMTVEAKGQSGKKPAGGGARRKKSAKSG